MSILSYERNPFEGAVISSDPLPGAPLFPETLEDTISHLREEKIKVVWMNLPASRAELVPAAVAARHGRTKRTASTTGASATGKTTSSCSAEQTPAKSHPRGGTKGRTH